MRSSRLIGPTIRGNLIPPTLPSLLLGALCYASFFGTLWSVSSLTIGGDAPIPFGVVAIYAVSGALFSWSRYLLRHSSYRITSVAIVVIIHTAVVASFLAISSGNTESGPSTIASGPSLWLIVALPVSILLSQLATMRLYHKIAYDDKTQNGIIIARLFRGIGFFFFISLVFIPFYFLLVSSVTPRSAILQNPTRLIIPFQDGWEKLTLGYREVWSAFNFGRYVFNSSLVSSLTVLLTLIPSTLGAYAVTRLRFRGRQLLSNSILLIYLFPAIVLVIPLYSVFTQLQLRNTLAGLLIVYPAMTIPVALYMLRGYFKTLPRDIEEAGIIDGCSRIGVIWRIVVPLSMPAIASVALYVFMIAWNEFLFAFMFLDSPDIYTLSRGVAALNSQEVPRQFLMAGAMIITAPVMMLFFFFERFLVGGLSAGSVKG